MSVPTADEVPAGYRPAERLDESMYPYICETCGATVARTAWHLHSEWHERIYLRIGAV